MIAPVRFTFDENFVSPFQNGEAGSETAGDSLRKEYESIGYARGFDDGRASDEAVAARLLADAAEAIAARLAETEALLETRLAAIEAEAAALALSFAHTLTLGLVPDAALVEETFRTAMRDLTGTLAVTVTINPKVLPKVDERLAALAAGVNPDARIRLISDRAMAPGDCSIRWAEGEITATRALREQRLAALVARAFPALRAPPLSAPASEVSR